MLKIRRILIPTDFSPCAEAAVVQGGDLARRCGAEVHVLHVDEGPGGPWRSLLRRLMDEMGVTEMLRDRVGEARRAREAARQLEGLTVHRAEVRDDDVPRAILTYAEAHDVDLIAMGTHGHRSLIHPALGGVSGDVVRRATRPVLTVHAPDEAPPPRPFRKLLVPVDFSEHAVQALRHARALAALYDASLTLLFVAEERVVPVFSDTGLPAFVTLKMPDEEVARSEEALRQLAASTPGPEVPVTYRVRPGHPAREILACAREEDIDLIVMSTHGAGGDRRFSLGSVTEHVVREAPHAVLTLKAFGRHLVEDPADPNDAS
ncbi:MAG: universal stress protein [Bacteroidetes bacterium]|nr:MAG: universal stress protein [Bacteroidota bacterium]GIV57825.1 MAG: universal stress protein [Rhodothermaceae bacterium]